MVKSPPIIKQIKSNQTNQTNQIKSNKSNKSNKMTYQNFKPETFSPEDDTDWLTHLEEEGYVVIKNILDESEIQTNLDLFKKEWNIVSPNFDWDNSETWTIENCPMMFGKGMSVFNGFGQSEFMWVLRTNPKIYQLYQKIFW